LGRPGVRPGMNRVIGERAFEEVAVDAGTARELLAEMVRVRAFDERALALQRRGWMSGYPSYRGQEASQVGAAFAMADDDWLFPTYRSNAMQLALGVPMSDIFLFRRGAAEYHSGHDHPVFPQAVPIATQIPHAAGAGMAANYRDADHGVVCYFGDGATSEGDFHEGLNFAGVFDAPVLFLCENNHWAISLPRSRQTASDSIAVKAEAYGFDGVQVDGNDPLAVYETVTSTLERVRAGEPVLLESLTYRQGAHTTADDPDRYEDRRGDLPDWRTADPIERYAGYLREHGVVEDGFVEEARETADERVAAAVERAEDAGMEPPETVFDHVFEDLPPRLREQRRRLLERVDDEDPRELDL
jgi:pyruvate dehydrogenase E1 component alpha subunit